MSTHRYARDSRWKGDRMGLVKARVQELLAGFLSHDVVKSVEGFADMEREVGVEEMLERCEPYIHRDYDGDPAMAIGSAAALAALRKLPPADLVRGINLMTMGQQRATYAGPMIDGKVVVDVTNPLTADYMGLTVGHTTSAAEEIAKAVPNAHVVKAFNTVFASVLAEGASLGGGKTVPVFVASDDAPAKATVSEIARSIGFDVVGAGALKNARYLEPLAGLNIYLGYGAGLGTNIAPAWLRQG